MEYKGITEVYSTASVAEQYQISPTVQTLVFITPFIVGAICMLGLVSNGLIILHIMVWTKVKSLANTFILNLALADLFFMVTLPFMGYQLARGEWIFGPFLCRLIVPYDAMTQFTVVFFLVVMSLDRYLAFCQPIKSMHFRTLTHGRIISMVVWIAAFVVTLPVWLFSSHHCGQHSLNPSNETHCVCVLGMTPGYSSYDNSTSNNDWFSIYTLTLDFCIPLIIICGCYLLILWNLIRNPLKEMSSTTRRASRRITVLVICIVFVFVLCFLPFFIVQLYVNNMKEKIEDRHMVAYTVSWFLMYAHSIINPVVYTMIGVNFRQHIVSFFRSVWQPKPAVQKGAADKTSSLRLCMSRSSMRYTPGTENIRQVRNGTIGHPMKQFDLKATELSALSKYEESL